MGAGYTYTFPALRGIQAGRVYYVAMCPLKLLPRIFLFDESEIPADLRAQRILNTARIPEITRYILDNPKDYAFSAITASVDAEIDFQPYRIDGLEQDFGLLVAPMTARYLINDGQHRRAAIESALRENPDLGEEAIAVVFYHDEGLRRSQQLFADLNKHAVRPTKSLGVLYDHRAPLSALVRDLVGAIPCFRGLTDLENTTLSNRSTKLFTLSGIFQATSALLDKKGGDPISDDEANLAHAYWQALCRILSQWRQAAERQVRSSELRKEYVNVHSVLLHALGIAGHSVILNYPNEWEQRLENLREVDWSRSNQSIWQGRAMQGGAMSKARVSLELTAEYLIEVLEKPIIIK